MGVLVLVAALLAALTACEPVPRDPGAESTAPAVEEMAHADLACRACHSGAPIPGREAAVPAASCQSSGCHEAGGPEEVLMATVTFPHRNHGEAGEIDLTCAGCHTHPTGDAPLEASVDACALCHVGQVTGGGHSEECRVCHTQPDHARLTSQGVAVSHSQLPWTEIGCVRCHYDVAAAETAVAGGTCRSCHDDLAAINEAAVGRDMHPLHDGITCTSCHVEDTHVVQSMSSAVDLVCSDCHRQAHDLALRDASGPDADVCASCHGGIHAAQQRLLLGIRPDGDVVPSGKFLAGITCRSCHVPTAAGVGPADAIRGQATACAGCHADEYTQVLDWWLDGIRARLEASRSYVETAAGSIDAPSDSAATLLRDARAMVTLVAEAGGQHNLELADRLLREAVTRARQAYGAAGRTAPSIPDLGRVPHSGMCSYCHYSPSEPWNFEEMPDEFHRTIMGEDG